MGDRCDAELLRPRDPDGLTRRPPDLGALDLRRLRTLERVGRHRSFSRAASDLHFTQSAVSQQIATLERDLGALLVHRNPVALTDAGTALCRRYESAVAELAAAQAELDAFREGGSMRLRVAATPGSPGKLLARAIAAVSSCHPDIDVRVSFVRPTEAVRALRLGEADLAVTHRFDACHAETSRIHEIPLVRDRLTLAVPRGHELAGRHEVSLDQLADQAWIDVPDVEVPREVLDVALQGQPYRPGVVLESGGLHSAQLLVAAGVGVAFVPSLDKSHDADVEHLTITGRGVGRSIYGAILSSSACDGVVGEMLDALSVGAQRMTLRPRLIGAVGR